MDSSPVVKESGLKMASEKTFYIHDLLKTFSELQTALDINKM